MSRLINPTNQRWQRLGRRSFLGGAAVAVGLPWLESLKSARAQSAEASPIRQIYYMLPNGLDMASFRPSTTGSGYAMPPLLAPLETLRDDFLIVTGLENAPAWPDELGHHAAGTASLITCAHANKSLTDIRLGISADQVAAQQFAGSTRLPSMQLGIEGGSRAGDCDSGYACDYARNISWANETTPLPKLTDPQTVFDSIFEGYDSSASDAELARRQERRSSVLDLVTQDANDLYTKLGYNDKTKIDQYLTGVRELEQRLEGSNTVTCEPGTAPGSSREMDYETQMRAMADLMVTAIQCDATRIISFMQGNALSNRTYPFLNISRGHHDISHHGGQQENIDMLIQIGTWEFEQIAYLMSRLKEIPDGIDGGSNVLFNSIIFISSDISDGDRHNSDDKPIVVAGRGGGFLKGGEHIAYPGGFGKMHEKQSNLLVTLLAAAGVATTLGDSDKELLPEVVA